MSRWHNGRFIGRYAAYIQTSEGTYAYGSDENLEELLAIARQHAQELISAAVEAAAEANGGALSQVKQRAIAREYYANTKVHIYGFSGFWGMREITERCKPHGWIPEEYHFRSYRFTNRGGLK